MVRTHAADVLSGGGASPPVARGRGRAPAPARGRGRPRVAPVVTPVDPVEDLVIEEQDEVVEIARGIEGIRQQGREQAPRDKWPRYSGGFSGALSRGRVQPYFSAIPESSYRPPAIQGSSSGCSGPHGQTQGQSSSAPRGCYECRELGHSLDAPVYVSMLVGNSVILDRIYRSCIMTFCGYETREDLLLLDITDFDVILDIGWLSLHHVVLDCHAKTVTLAMPELPRLEWRGSSISIFSRVISFLKAGHMVEKGCLGYLLMFEILLQRLP
ncbi:uncharacterized protein [Nicotiana tomentosiformis]|uniref:uncharacterized protein n=1 Tax=Nicotiana tomentosiformis TaxID=4098 RepID=UPI00388C90D6